ncbi:BglG family transcription antiterminator [Oceanobacillus profundus]|uniref:BglG family transcription antiterminator n=1 Tax=Oceanobacillus profundus TaxID=372463 RepID=UPI00362D798E
MDQRSMAILNKIIQQDSYISVQKLATIFNVSRRTIYNDLDKINDWLKLHHFADIKQVRGQGFYIDEISKKEITKKKEHFVSDVMYYDFSPIERKAWIYIHIAGQEQPYYLEHIRDLFKVSRNTVLDDISKLKEELKKYKLSITSERNTGYSIVGNENDTRKLLTYYLDLVIPQNGCHELLSGMNSLPEEQVFKPFLIFKFHWLKELHHLLNEYEKQFKIEITDDVLNNLVIWFHFFLRRIMQGKIVNVDPIEKEVIKSTSEFDGAKALCINLSKQLDIIVPDNEVYYFAKYLLSAKVNYDQSLQVETQEIKSLLHVVEKMVDDFQMYAAVEFHEQQSMIQNLLLHLKPAYYRNKYGIQIENTLRDSVKQNYPEIFNLTKKVIHHFEELIGQPIHENEIAYCAMHFGGWLRKEGVMLGQTSKRLLIVCTNGLGTSRLLESQLEGLFSDTDIVGVTSLREYERMNLNIDYIVSTISLPDRGVPVFVVNPVLNNADKEQLLKKVNSLFEYSHKQQVYSVDSVIDMVQRYATIHDNDTLRQELRRYFHTPIKGEGEVRKPSLYELLPPERIVLNKSISNWKEAVISAADPLLNQGYIQESYITKMIQNITEKGPYIVISEHFALPHANPEDGVMKTGMSMLHLTEPVDLFGKPASVIIILASRDNEQHLKALSQLTKLFSVKANKEKMIQTTNKSEIKKLIYAYSN